MILQASGGRKWSVKYELRKRERCEIAELCRGWREFARDNNFEVGDVCVFEFIKGNEISLKVSISRATEDANRHRYPGKKSFHLLIQYPICLECVCIV